MAGAGGEGASGLVECADVDSGGAGLGEALGELGGIVQGEEGGDVDGGAEAGVGELADGVETAFDAGALGFEALADGVGVGGDAEGDVEQTWSNWWKRSRSRVTRGLRERTERRAPRWARMGSRERVSSSFASSGW